MFFLQLRIIYFLFLTRLYVASSKITPDDIKVVGSKDSIVNSSHYARSVRVRKSTKTSRILSSRSDGTSIPTISKGSTRRISTNNNEDNNETDRVLIQYKNENGRLAIQKVATTVYYHSVNNHFLSVEIDMNGLSLLSSNKDIIQIEPDSVWTEQGILEEVVSAKDIENNAIEKKYPHLVRRIRNSSRRRNLKGAVYTSESIPYGISMTQADQIEYGSHPAMVCIVDTGTLPFHPDLDRSLVSGTSRSSNKFGTFLAWNNDRKGHGTHISGIVNAKGGNNLGIRGMGKIPTYITRGLDDQGNARESDISEAMEQCEQAGAKVISLSLSGPSLSTALKTVIDRLYDKQIMVVSAAGNDGLLYEAYPASYEKVVSVGAIDETEQLWSKSNYGPAIELTAPGHMILSTSLFANGYYTFSFYSGTSMATPHVASAAALLFSHYPDCTVTQIRYAMAYTAKDKGNQGCDDIYGYGIVQVKDAYDFLSTHPCNDATTNWGQIIGDGRCSAIDTTSPTPEEKAVETPVQDTSHEQDQQQQYDEEIQNVNTQEDPNEEQQPNIGTGIILSNLIEPWKDQYKPGAIISSIIGQVTNDESNQQQSPTTTGGDQIQLLGILQSPLSVVQPGDNVNDDGKEEDDEDGQNNNNNGITFDLSLLSNKIFAP